ncbi:MAG TPA: lipocalin family protein [Panacibacter sp.]|nr:lipocalin family protein [Panacibacter sp.]
MKNTILFLFATVIVFGCSKSNSSTTNTPVTMQSLAGNYKITAATVAGADILSSYLTPCQQDDIYTLNADGTYVIADAGTVCSPTSATSSTWTLSGNQITIDGQVFTLVKFDGAKIEATTSVTQSGYTVTVDVIFTKQ